MELKDRNDLKFVEKSDRSVEELKDRYYSVAKAVLQLRG